MFRQIPFKKEYVYFKKCSELLNISRAAEQLGITQSALSKIIAQLEHELKVLLFQRTSRGLKLTPHGLKLLHSINSAGDVWFVSQNNEVILPTWQKQLHVGFHPIIGRSILPVILPNLYKAFDDFNLITSFGTSTEITQRVNLLEIDLGFVINPIKNPRLVPKKIKNEYIAVWKSKTSHKILMYNPEMYLAPKIVEKLSNTFKLIPIKNYDIIAECINKDICYGILPNPLAESYNFIKYGSDLLSVDLCMVLHTSKFSAADRKKIFEFFSDSLTL